MKSPRLAVLLAAMAALALVPDDGSSKKKREPETVEDLQVVDCLLPGKVRRLGRRSTFLTPRQPVRTTAVDCEIRGGEYTAFDRASYATALAVWLPAAEVGDAQAQTYVGEIFEKGLAATPDYAAAALWYRKAADQGFQRAQINLGHLYEKGLGVPLDPQAALEWYRRAAGIEEAVVLDWTEQEATLRQEAAELRQELAATRERLDATLAELAAAQAEAAELRRQLDEARRSQASTENEKQELATRLAASEARVGEIRRSVQDYRDRLARLEAASASGAEVAPPTIAIISPDVLSTRGPAIVAVPADVAELEITGRVTAPAGLARLTVDGAEQQADDSGFFRVVRVAPRGRTALTIEARDRRGRVVRRELLLEPGAQGPSPDVPPPPPPPRTPRPSPDHHALVISAANYRNLPPLKTAAADAAEVARVLAEKYGYQTTLLSDPTHFEILAAINRLAAELDEKDHLVIYYAGHGKIEGGKGYWIGVDGAADDSALWIPNEAISDQLDVMKAREVLVVSDSCYSGTLTLSGVARLGDEEAERAARRDRIAARRSRTVLTSGGLQPVLDEGGGRFSIFAQAFLRVLELNESPLAGAELHREVAARVRYAARSLGFRQTPDYAPIRYAGHEAGDYVLAPQS